ncbi:hypothetical protein KO481_30065 [Nocardia sp. NEAU-G5]|uniref:Uncharacterized protein n=1 Tax=Nocardia albiluteola TaxID=2842303 RepID=A0ABS6B956_9NOCA|nr:hypothetical protein [Nocardia albiluteola]MBU3065758.1 hypothetical protein [Nocardia albiluteola]
MTTSTSHPQQPGPGPRPGVPLPGQHLGGADPAEFADPATVRAEVEALLAELTAGPRVPGEQAQDLGVSSPGAGVEITRRAHILEQAHEVLVQALTTVDKI